jgi:hypothetical protein
MKNQQSYQDRVNTIVERDNVTITNLTALFRHSTAEAVVKENVHQWLVRAALRRNRKAQHDAHAPLNNALNLAFSRTKVRR